MKKVEEKKPNNNQDESRPRPVDKSPIYIVARKMNKTIAEVIAGMDRKYRYQTGTFILKQGFVLSTIITRTYRAFGNLNLQFERANQIIDECDLLISMLQSAYDNHIICRPHFVMLIDSCVSIMKQTTGWINAIYSKLSANNISLNA